MGRFINADALVSTGQGILGNNMFGYCGNNPVGNVDYYGHAWAKISFDAFNPLDGGMFSPCAGGGSVAGGKAIISSLPESTQENNTSEYTWAWYDSGEVAFGPMNNHTYQIHGGVVTYSTHSTNHNSLSLGSVRVAALEGYVSKSGDTISLLNFGVSEVGANFSTSGFEVSAITSIWEPKLTLNCGFCTVVLTGNVGSIGGKATWKPGKFELGLAAAIGGSISIEW